MRAAHNVRKIEWSEEKAHDIFSNSTQFTHTKVQTPSHFDTHRCGRLFSAPNILSSQFCYFLFLPSCRSRLMITISLFLFSSSLWHTLVTWTALCGFDTLLCEWCQNRKQIAYKYKHTQVNQRIRIWCDIMCVYVCEPVYR